MGLFSRKSNEETKKDEEKNKYEELIRTKQYDPEDSFWNSLWDKIAVLEKSDDISSMYTEYTFLPCLLSKVLNEEAVHYLINRKGAPGAFCMTKHCASFVKLWGHEYFFNKDDFLVQYINSPIYLEYLSNNKEMEYEKTVKRFHCLYNAYVDVYTDMNISDISDYIGDSNAVINNDSWYLIDNEDEQKELARIDLDLFKNPSVRNSVLYFDDGEIKPIDSVRRDYEKYKQTGNTSTEL